MLGSNPRVNLDTTVQTSHLAIHVTHNNRRAISMRKFDDILAMCRVKPGETVKLKDFDPGWAGDESLPKEERKQIAKDLLTEDVSDLAEAQDTLYASDCRSILLIFQALDAAGKDGTIKHVMSGVNPQGCQVYSFKQPSTQELEHNFLWRYTRSLPERGRIGIFNRSYYEDVLVVRVHPNLIDLRRLPDSKITEKFWQQRYEDINNLEQHLTRNGTTVLKFFLNVSKAEQRKRFLKRLEDPKKHWKFSPADLAERAHWDDYIDAYERAITATNTDWARWHIIPADHKWITRAIVARVLANTIKSFNLQYPEITDEQRKAIEEAKQEFGSLELEHAEKKKSKKKAKKEEASSDASSLS